MKITISKLQHLVRSQIQEELSKKTRVKLAEVFQDDLFAEKHENEEVKDKETDEGLDEQMAAPPAPAPVPAAPVPGMMPPAAPMAPPAPAMPMDPMMMAPPPPAPGMMPGMMPPPAPGMMPPPAAVPPPVVPPAMPPIGMPPGAPVAPQPMVPPAAAVPPLPMMETVRKLVRQKILEHQENNTKGLNSERFKKLASIKK